MDQFTATQNISIPATQEKQTIDVLHWHLRHVVFDHSIQPKDPAFVLLYFVQGRALCVRSRQELSALPVKHPGDREFAIEQYMKWRLTNQSLLERKINQQVLVHEDPPAARMKCPDCDGSPNWVDAIVKPTYGVKSEGPNIVERCNCGSGWIPNVFD
jgi:hypothetical protein